ncbi:MAG: prepilin-type N-terminal cleavage/methylation domain-containing protein [Candidatus Omnitrophica bacterium]|nr:prepilin-type N-terminal cleavage/methylation domain-containing protein [Candidatus Omnitrophota bacterium]
MNRSFTLIELLIVIVIIGILASLAIPQYTKFTDQAKGAEAVANLGALRRALNGYYVGAGDYPRPEIQASEFCTRSDARRVLPSTLGLIIKLMESPEDPGNKRKWDYGGAASPIDDHAGSTDYTIYAFPSSNSSIDTRDPAEMAKWWHGHMYKGQPVGRIINKYPWNTTHSWADHQ